MRDRQILGEFAIRHPALAGQDFHVLNGFSIHYPKLFSGFLIVEPSVVVLFNISVAMGTQITSLCRGTARITAVELVSKRQYRQTRLCNWNSGFLRHNVFWLFSAVGSGSTESPCLWTKLHVK